MMLKYAVRDGRLCRNPSDGVNLPRIVKQKHGYLTHAQVHHLADLAGIDGALILFLAYTGLRWVEAAALRVSDLDMLRRRINVDQAVTGVGRELVYGTPKNHSRRTLPFPSFHSEVLIARASAAVTSSSQRRWVARCVTATGVAERRSVPPEIRKTWAKCGQTVVRTPVCTNVYPQIDH
jgi:integrase